MGLDPAWTRSGSLAPLPSPLTADGGFSLPFPLCTGLFVETTFPELRVEPGPLYLPLEPAQCTVEAFVVLDENFQTDHAPFVVFKR